MVNILLVDDNLHYVHSISDLLQQHQFTVQIASNALLAFKIAKEYEPKVIVMDWDMPEINGIEATKYLKADPQTKDIPIIIASGVMTTTEHLKEALDAGALDYIRKPIDGIELLARVQTALRVKNYFHKLADKNEELALKNVELAHKNEELKKSNEVQNRLMSIISHDLKSPLHSLQGSIMIAREFGEHGISQEEFFQILNQIEEEFTSVIGLINSLLFWALNRQEAFVYQPEVINISELLTTSTGLLDNQAKKKSIRFKSECPTSLLANTDSNMFRFIVRNLLSNAIKFTPKGGQVSIELFQQKRDLFIEVSDTGIGLSNEQQVHLFDHIDPSKVHSDTYGRKGTGLGLAVALEFAQKMGGNISVKSIIGEGSTFCVLLPDCVLEDQIFLSST